MEGIGDHVKNLACKLHHSKRMLESPVRGTGIYEIGESQLVDIAKSLYRLGVEDRAFFGRDSYESMNRVTYLVDDLRKHLTIAFGWGANANRVILAH